MIRLDESGKRKALLVFAITYLLAFTLVAWAHHNYEFLYYTAIMSCLVLLVILYHKPLQLSTSIMLLLTIVGALHILGGNVHPNGVRLYDTWLIGHGVKYDNLIHFLGSFTATLIAYNLLSPYLDTKLKRNKLLLGLLLVLIASGLGAINEILELGAVVYLNAGQQVGDYFNNAFDLVWNFAGAAAAALIIIARRK